MQSLKTKSPFSLVLDTFDIPELANYLTQITFKTSVVKNLFNREIIVK